MKYTGTLYGRQAGKYFPLVQTSADIDAGEAELLRLRDEVIALREQVERQWISVKEKEPEFGQVCLCAKAGKVLGFSQWGSKDIPLRGWVFPNAPMYTAWIGQDITHWMHLPEPPQLSGEKVVEG